MTQKILPLIFVIFFCLWGCESKEIPKPNIPSPVFSFDAVIDEIDYRLSAGVDQYYQFTTSIPPGGGWPYSWEGELKKNTCTGCAPQIKVRFFDTDLRSFPSEQDVFTSLLPGKRQTRFIETPGGGTLNGSILILNAHAPAPGNDYQHEWIFSDGTKVYGPSARREIKKAGTVEILLVSTRQGFPGDTLLNQIYFSSPSEACFSPFEYVPLGDNIFRLIANQGFDNYLWQIDGLNLSGRVVDVDLSGYEKAKVLLTVNRSNCSSVFSRQIPVSQNFSSTIADMSIRTEPFIFATDSINVPLGQGEITWTSPNGDIYTSTRRTDGPSQNNLEIINRVPYETNESGKKTIKLELSYDGYLYRMNQEKDSIRMKTNRWVTAVAVP